MRRLYFILFCFLALEMSAQTYFNLKADIPVSNGVNQLRYPWAGGINFPVFSAVDIDSDGMEDLFVFDRSNNRATLYINTGTGGINSYRYAPEYSAQLPALRGWALFYDYNCDGKADLFTTGLTNNGILQFRNDSQVGSIQFTAVDSMMKADYGGGSLSGIFASGFLMPHFNDIDGDGDMDVLGQQFFCAGTFAYYRNLSMDDYGVCDSLSHYVLDTYAWGKFALRSGAYPNVAVGSYHISCIMASPPDDMFGYELALQDDTYAGIFTIDIDDDGDMDALIGDSGAGNSLLVFNGGTQMTADMDSQDTLFPSYDVPVQLNSFTTHAYIDADHDGVKDLLVGHNEFENKQGVLFYKNTGTTNLPVFDFITNGFLQDHMIDVGEGACPVLFDADADGKQDLIIGNVNSTDTGGTVKRGLSYYRNTGTLTNPAFTFITNDYAGISIYPLLGPLFPAFGDLDADGDMDLLLGVQTGELYHFQNTAGVGMPANFVFVTANYFGIDIGNFCFPQLVDLNRDGKLDLVVGKKSGVIAYFENVGTPASAFFLSQATKDTLGGVIVQTPGYLDGYAVPFVYDDSSSYKMLVACMRGDVFQYGDIDGNVLGIYTSEDTVFSRVGGIRTSFNLTVSGGDINSDGKTDMLLGLYGGGLQFYLQDTLSNGIQELADRPSFRVYPNPVSDYFFVEMLNLNNTRKQRVRISDSMGRILKEENLKSGFQSFSTAGFSSGVYFVTVIDAVSFSTERIVIIH